MIGFLEQSLSWQGVNIFALSAGARPFKGMVVMLHGMGGGISHWFQTAEVLAERGYQVIVLDLPGHGKSAMPEKLSPEWIGRNLAEWIEEPAILIGHSLGGWVALRAYLHNPKKVKALVLVASAGLEGIVDRPPKVRLDQGLNVIDQIVRSAIYKPEALDPQVLQDLMLGTVTAPALLRMKPEGKISLEELGQVHIPTLLYWGKEDGLIPVTWAEQFRKHIAKSQLVIKEQCGHLPQIEQPEHFEKTLFHFLQTLP
jgi:pimeloyl-ACP methyl ester carboxylesterase